MDQSKMEYLPTEMKPTSLVVPEDKVLVHSHVKAMNKHQRQGVRGFRFWFYPKSLIADVAECDCGWLPEAGKHFTPTRHQAT